MALQFKLACPALLIATGSTTLPPTCNGPKLSVAGLTMSFAGVGTMLKRKLALREPRLSVAWMVCVPGDQLAGTTTLASKAPVALTEMLVFPAACCSSPASSSSAAPAACVLLPAACPVGATGMPLSSVSVTLPPGRKPWPCRCKMLPVETVLFPLRERPGELASTSSTPPLAMTMSTVRPTMSHFVAVPTAILVEAPAVVP